MTRALVAMFATVFGLVACKQSAPAPEATPQIQQPATATPTPQPANGNIVPTSPSSATARAAADPWTTEAPKKDPLPRPFFWSAEKDGKTTYLLGTIHMGIDAEARLPQIVWDKLDAARTFAMETDLGDPILQTALKCIGCSLKKELGDVYWKKLETAIGADLAARLEGQKPMVVATLLSMRGLPQTPQMDTLLLARAQRLKHGVVYLEPASSQVRNLEKWMNVKALKLMLDDLAAGERMTKVMLDAYATGDETKMIASSEDEKKLALEHGYSAAEYEQQMKDMLYDRNASWIAPIEKLHAEGGGFIAVGAMHLVGPKSVLELLGKKGFKITRITP